MAPELLIPLYNRRAKIVGETKVSPEDYGRLSKFRWSLHHKGYARRSVQGRDVFMHREVLGISDPSVDVDHINRDRLDNRRANLRPGKRGKLSQNTSSRKGTSSRHRGVCWETAKKRWRASVGVNYRRINLGRFKTEEAAARAAAEARRRLLPFSEEGRACLAEV